MSRYVRLALYREGPTDRRFLSPLLFRVVWERVAAATEPVELPEDVLELRPGPDEAKLSQAERIEKLATDADGLFELLFIHADGAGNPAAALANCVVPGAGRVHAKFGTEVRAVPVVPVREMEAWAIADPEAFCRVVGVSKTADELGLPQSAKRVEGVLDPKKALDDAVVAAFGLAKRRSVPGGAAYLAQLGDEVSLDRLRSVPAFAQLEADIDAALKVLGILR